MLSYHYKLTPNDNGTFLLTFLDIPEAVAVISGCEEIQTEGLEGPLCALDGYFADRRGILTPSGPDVLTLPALETAKVSLLFQHTAA